MAIPTPAERTSVRLKISDTETPYIFSDDELDVFLEENGNNVFSASADALRTILINKVLFGKFVQTIRQDDITLSSFDPTRIIQGLIKDYETKVTEEDRYFEVILRKDENDNCCI